MEVTRYFPGDDPLTPKCTGYYTMPVYTDEPVRTAGGGWESAAQVGIAVRDSALQQTAFAGRQASAWWHDHCAPQSPTVQGPDVDSNNRRVISVSLGPDGSCNPLLGKLRVTALTAASVFSTGAPGETFNAGATSDTLQLDSTDSYTYFGKLNGRVWLRPFTRLLWKAGVQLLWAFPGSGIIPVPACPACTSERCNARCSAP